MEIKMFIENPSLLVFFYCSQKCEPENSRKCQWTDSKKKKKVERYYTKWKIVTTSQNLQEISELCTQTVWACLCQPFPWHETRSPTFTKKRLLNKCFGISFKLRNYHLPRCEKERETKVWDTILRRSLWEILWKKINMGPTEHSQATGLQLLQGIHVGEWKWHSGICTLYLEVLLRLIGCSKHCSHICTFRVFPAKGSCTSLPQTSLSVLLPH